MIHILLSLLLFLLLFSLLFLLLLLLLLFYQVTHGTSAGGWVMHASVSDVKWKQLDKIKQIHKLNKRNIIRSSNSYNLTTSHFALTEPPTLAFPQPHRLDN